MVRWELDPRRCALLVVDLQRLFVEGYPPISAPEGPTVLEAMNKLSATCRELGILVIYTAHALRPDLANIGTLEQQFPPMKDGLLSSGTEAVGIDERYVIEPQDIYLEKPRFGAFTGTDLELILRGKGIDTVIIGGIATNVCCETTAREANHREFKVVFLSDGTTSGEYADVGFGALTPAEVQKATLTIIAYAFGEVTTCDDVATRLRHSATDAPVRT
jgi:ureidoacrylate peracid hydrolase